MRGLIALIVYLIGVGVTLSPTVKSKWNTASAAQFANDVGQDLPFALGWPARVYQSIARQG